MDDPHVRLHHNPLKCCHYSLHKEAMEESKKYERMVKQTMDKNKKKNNKRGHGSGSGSGLLGVKVRKLQILIPGGKRCNHPDLLLSKTVDYIVHLKLKIRFLKALSDMTLRRPNQDFKPHMYRTFQVPPTYYSKNLPRLID
ncbi:hypothetical protein YC2023_016504 [Brassica napus]